MTSRPSDSEDRLFARRSEPEVRRELVERYDRLATSLAERFVRSGDERDDARQIARVALLKAIDGFDPDLGFRFTTYASRTILGELKRARRDRSWDIRVPRALQERWLAAARARDDLTHELERPPTIAEIATRIEATTEDVLEALDAGRSHTVGSIDQPVGDETGATVVADRLGSRDQSIQRAPVRVDLADAIEDLDDRDRRLLYLRFFRGMTQSEVAKELGVSQMHVSRLLRSALRHLRERQTT